MDPAHGVFLGILGVLFVLNVLRYALADKLKRDEDRCLGDHVAVPWFAKFVPERARCGIAC